VHEISKSERHEQDAVTIQCPGWRENRPLMMASMQGQVEVLLFNRGGNWFLARRETNSNVNAV
jgi:hypothetical protein